MAHDRTLVQIRERTYLDVLDLALVVMRDRPVTIALAAIAGVAPFAALNAWLLTIPELGGVVVAFLIALEVPWATAPLTVVLGGLMFGERPTVWRVTGTLVRSFFPMLFCHFFVRGFLFTSGILYLLIPIRLAFLNEVILLERGRWTKTMRRSAELCKQREGELFAQWMLQLTFGGIFILGFWLGMGALLNAFVDSELTWQPQWNGLFDSPLCQTAMWIAITFFGVARFLSYIDQRIRLEGWEVELRLRHAGLSLGAIRR